MTPAADRERVPARRSIASAYCVDNCLRAFDLPVALHGQSGLERAPGTWRAIAGRLELTADAESFRWLNTQFLVCEGEIDDEREVWWLCSYVWVRGELHGLPAIGAEAPDRFR